MYVVYASQYANVQKFMRNSRGIRFIVSKVLSRVIACNGDACSYRIARSV
jgi:hypothetical protein